MSSKVVVMCLCVHQKTGTDRNSPNRHTGTADRQLPLCKLWFIWWRLIRARTRHRRRKRKENRSTFCSFAEANAGQFGKHTHTHSHTNKDSTNAKCLKRKQKNSRRWEESHKTACRMGQFKVEFAAATVIPIDDDFLLSKHNMSPHCLLLLLVSGTFCNLLSL